MHLKSDYTEQKGTEVISEETDIEKVIGEDNKLGQYLQYYRLWSSQYKRTFSQAKKDKVFLLYKQLDELAFIHNGKVSLDINEEKMNARLVYWGDALSFLPNELDRSRSTLLSLLKVADMVYLSAVDGGIEIRIVEELCDKVVIRNEQAALAKLEESIHNSRTSTTYKLDSNES